MRILPAVEITSANGTELVPSGEVLIGSRIRMVGGKFEVYDPDESQPYHTAEEVIGIIDPVPSHEYIVRGAVNRIPTESGMVLVFDGASFAAGTYAIPDNSTVKIIGRCTGNNDVILRIGLNTTVIGYPGNSCTGFCFQFIPTAKDSSISRCNMRGLSANWNSGVEYLDGIWMLSSSSSVPKNCTIEKNSFYKCLGGFRIYGADSCRIVDNYANYCHWSFYISSANNSLFSGNISIVNDKYLPANQQLPVVGFLNMPTQAGSDTELYNTRRGITNNQYVGNIIDGWNEEGFSFDGNNATATKASSHVSGVTPLGVSINSARASWGAPGMSLVFHTGRLAGRSFKILSISNKTLNLLEFSNFYTLASLGDFITIEIPCYGNVVSNNIIKSSGDNDGIECWGFGANTVFSNNSLENGARVTVQGMCNNVGAPWYYAPHNISFIHNKFSNASFIASTLSIVVVMNHDNYNQANLDDSSIPYGEMCTIGVSIERENGYEIAIAMVKYLRINFVNQFDIFKEMATDGTPTLCIENRLQITDAQLAKLVPADSQEIINNGTIKRHIGGAWVEV